MIITSVPPCSSPLSQNDTHLNPTMLLTPVPAWYSPKSHHDPHPCPSLILTYIPPWSSPLSQHHTHLSPTRILYAIPQWSSSPQSTITLTLIQYDPYALPQSHQNPLRNPNMIHTAIPPWSSSPRSHNPHFNPTWSLPQSHHDPPSDVLDCPEVEREQKRDGHEIPDEIFAEPVAQQVHYTVNMLATQHDQTKKENVFENQKNLHYLNDKFSVKF